MASDLPFWQVDAFSSVTFEGNPAAVCLLVNGELPSELRQKIAAENNLSETAYVSLPDASEAVKGGLDAFKAGSVFGLRWHTPTHEVPLCGHATLAAAHVLLRELGNPNEAIHFDTLSGRLAVKAAAGADGRLLLQLDLPLSPPLDPFPASLRQPAPTGVSAAAPGAADGMREGKLGDLVSACTGGLGASFVGFATGVDYLLMVLPDGTTREQLEAVRPDYNAMRGIVGPEEVHGVIVTTQAGGGGYDFCSRFFGPWLGIDEDPVTGSAYCVLGPYWGERLLKKELAARQCSPRGGDVFVGLPEGAGAAGGRVLVSGEGVTTIRGAMLVPKH